MIIKKKFILFTLLLIIIFQALLYTNNNQKTTFRFFRYNIKEVTIGKLISISFFSGLFISTILNSTFTSHKKNTFENKNIDENYESLDNEEEINSNIEMPPQRDVRETQPTISVNYRVVKSTEENNMTNNQNYSKSPDYKDDWDNTDNDW